MASYFKILLLFQILILSKTLIKSQDIECDTASLCNQITISHTVQIKTHCVYLNINFRNMTEEILQVGVFRLCRVAVIVDLSNNKIKAIKAGAFLGLASVREMYLANNEIEKIEPGTFHTLMNLEVFVMTGNRLKSIPEYEFTSKYIKYFNINNNNLNYIPESSLLNLRHTELVDLSSNNLDQITPTTLKNVQPGVKIILNNNQLTNLTMEFTNISTSKVIFYSTLAASGNIITELRDDLLGDFFKLNLQTLDLSFNFISEIDVNTFHNYTTLEHIFLSRNRMKALDSEVFKSLKFLKTLDLGYNLFTSIIFQIKLPDSITKLDYSNNKIESFPEYHWSAVLTRSYMYLDISNNTIKFIDGNRFCKYIKRVNLAYNDWSCDVLYSVIRNLVMRDIIVEGGKDYLVENINGIPCKTGPSKLLDSKLENVKKMLYNPTTSMTTANLELVKSNLENKQNIPHSQIEINMIQENERNIENNLTLQFMENAKYPYPKQYKRNSAVKVKENYFLFGIIFMVFFNI